MLIKVLRSKIHRATVTDKQVGYSGSITVDPELLEKVGLVNERNEFIKYI